MTLTGQLLDLAVNATSRFGSTALKAKTTIAVQATNKGDCSTVRMTLNGAGSERVFWFEPKDAHALLNGVLARSLDKVLENTKIENNLLRLT